MENGQVYKITVPKNEFVQTFTPYVIGPNGDEYSKKTIFEEISFNPQDIVIDIYNQGIIEEHQNKLPTQIWQFEMLLGKAEVLLQALEREEQIYAAQKYNSISDKITETAKKSKIVADSLTDTVGILFWQYIAKSKNDTLILKTCIKALISHQFKCKVLYQTLYGKQKSITLD
jgi:hypothetical protein